MTEFERQAIHYLYAIEQNLAAVKQGIAELTEEVKKLQPARKPGEYRYFVEGAKKSPSSKLK